MRKRPTQHDHSDGGEDKQPQPKRLKSTILEKTSCIVRAERGEFSIEEGGYPYLGYTITTAHDANRIGVVMAAANGFWPQPIVMLVCGYVSEHHMYACGVSMDQICCEGWGCMIKDVRQMKRHAAEQAFLAALVGKPFKTFRWSLTPPTSAIDFGGEGGGNVDVELILDSDNSAGREVITFHLWCNHNGFYPHSVVLKRDEEADFQTL